MKLAGKLLIITFSLFALSCSTESAGDGDNQEPRTVEDVIEDFQNLDIQPGINDVRLETLVNGVYWNFRVIAPSDDSPTNKRPLVIDLHGESGGNSTAHQNSDCYAEEGLASLNAFIISPNAGLGQWYDAANQQQILALVDLAKSNWNVNPDQLVITGYSNGGNGSWFYADYYPEIFSAAIPMASSYDPERADGTVPHITVPLYVIHGENDELFPVEETEGFVEKARDAGASAEFVIAEGLGHLDVCDYTSYLQEAALWVQNEIWD